MKSRSTYARAGFAALLFVCLAALSGCAREKSQINEFRGQLKTLSPTYSADYSFKGGPLSGPGYVFGKVSDADGRSLFFCAHPNQRRVRPVECRAMRSSKSCQRLTLATDVNNPAGRLSPADREARREMAVRLNKLLYDTGVGCE